MNCGYILDIKAKSMMNIVFATFVWFLVFSKALCYFLSDNSIHNRKVQMSAMLEKTSG